MKLRMYCERRWIPEGCQQVGMLDPFWPTERYDPEGSLSATEQGYHQQARDLFEIVSTMRGSDAVLLPVDWHDLLKRPSAMALVREVIDRAAMAGKRVIIFYCHDAPLRHTWPSHALVFRIAVQHSQRTANEFIIPQWSRNYFTQDINGDLAFLPKTHTPVVGFCGFAPPLGMPMGIRKSKEMLRLAAHFAGLARFFPTRMAHAARARALMALSKSALVKTNFLIRAESAFANPIGAFLPGGTIEAAKEQRADFLGNILTSNYVLCARGWANCSIRFYETLSLGRIPVLIDTDVMLPLEFAIDWSRYCVRVGEWEISQIGQKVAAFHAGLSFDEFEARQRECRTLYEDWLSPGGFFRNLYQHLNPLAGRKPE